jgi:hypothetical protein
MHLFKSQLLQEADRPRIGPYRDRGFGPRYARPAPDQPGIAARAVAACNDDVATPEGARAILRRMADYDQAA